MARKFVTLAEAAEQLGISQDELNEIRQRQEISGYRDGSSWKFKPEAVEELAAKLAQRGSSPGGSTSDSALEFSLQDSHGGDDLAFDLPSSGDLPIDMSDSGEDVVLLSELELGESAGASTSSTVIGKPGQPLSPEESDVKLSTVGQDSGLGSGIDMPPLELGGSGIDLAPEPGAAVPDSKISLADDVKTAPGPGSSIRLGEDDDDDEFVLSGPGSDITLSPGDSGISLMDPSDSGLSLDKPIELSAAAPDADFELSDSSSSGSVEGLEFDSDEVMEVKSDDDFLLTPTGGAAEDMDDSGSQVIALDSDSGAFGDADSSMFGSESSAGMGTMLEEDSGSAPALDAGGLGLSPAMATAGATALPAAGRETPWGMGMTITLGTSAVLMAVSAMMMYDLIRHMWSWDQPYAVNSSIMDAIGGIFGG